MTPEDKAKAGIVGVRKRRGRVNGLDAASKGRLPAMPENLRPELDATRATHKRRPASPGVRVYPDGKDGWMLDAPHRDLEAWEIQICEAFGTRSHSVMWTFLHQIAGLCEQSWRADPKNSDGRLMPREIELNFILAMIHSERPDTPLQAAMLAQMCATHLLQMRISGAALESGHWVDPSKAIVSAKLANAFANQSDAFLRLRGKVPKQQITVTYKREVHVHHHKHAHLHQSPPVEGDEEFSERAHADRSANLSPLAPIPALRGPDTSGNVVPLARGEGEGQMSDARKRARVRRSEG